MFGLIGIITFLAILGFGVVVFFASIYKRCPSDKILVKFGNVGTDTQERQLSAKCVHGGGELVFPVIQDYGWLDLTPLTIDIDLTDALSAQNIRVSTPSTYTVGVSTEPGVMENAAERLLGESLDDIRNLARDIIFGQMRVVIATMKIEKINADRDQFIQNISKALEPELEKVGLRLINVNIKDVNDKSGYIDALGREAAAQAINEAKKKVAQQERDGEIGKAEAEKEQRIRVAEADATAVEGENQSEVKIAESDSERRQKEADAERKAVAAEKVNQAQAQQEAYRAQKETEQARAEREEAAQRADTVVPAKIEKERIETLAEAEAEEERRVKQGEADGIRSVMEARAEGLLANLTSKGKGFRNIVESCNNNPELASLLMVTEQLPDLVSEQVKAISDIEFDSVTVWENGHGENGRTSTANFLSGLVGSLPPLHELTDNVGINLPDYLGSIEPDGGGLSGDDLEAMGEAIKQKGSRQKQAENEIRKLVRNHRDQLGDFDRNDEDDFQEDNLDEAVRTIVNWARQLSDDSSEWRYVEDGDVKGPVPLGDLRERLNENSNLYLTSDESGAFWVPFTLLQQASDRLESVDPASASAS